MKTGKRAAFEACVSVTKCCVQGKLQARVPGRAEGTSGARGVGPTGSTGGAGGKITAGRAGDSLRVLGAGSGRVVGKRGSPSQWKQDCRAFPEGVTGLGLLLPYGPPPGGVTYLFHRKGKGEPTETDLALMLRAPTMCHAWG